MSPKSERRKSTEICNGSTDDERTGGQQQLEPDMLGLIEIPDQPDPSSVPSIVQQDHDIISGTNSMATNANSFPLTETDTLHSVPHVDHSPIIQQAFLPPIQQRSLQGMMEEEYSDIFASFLQSPSGQHIPLDREGLFQGASRDYHSLTAQSPATASEVDKVSLHSLPYCQANAASVVASETNHTLQHVESSIKDGSSSSSSTAKDNCQDLSEANTLDTSSVKLDNNHSSSKGCDCEKGVIVIEAERKPWRYQHSRSSTVLICFAFLVLLSVTLAFIWPRLPLFQINGSSLSYTPQVVRTPALTKYAVGWNLDVSVDNRNNYLPLSIVSMDIFVRHSASGTIFGHGKQHNLVITGYSKYNLSLPLKIEYDGKPDDPVMYDIFAACGPGPRTNETHVLQVHFGVKISIWGLSYFGYNPTVILTPPAGGATCTPSTSFNVTFYTDSCNSQMLSCDPGSRTCQWRSCTILGITPGWNNATHTPPTSCASDTFCPNSQLHCLPLLSAGSSCDKGRDDECAGSYAVCLNSVCSSKTASLNSICATELLSDGYSSVGVVRDNCTYGTYCSALNGIGVCQEALEGGVACLQNRQCLSQQCNNGTCVAPASSADNMPPWKWAIVGVIIVVCLISVGFVTFTVLRKKKQQELGILRYDDPTQRPHLPRWARRWTFWNRKRSNTTTDYNLDEPEKPVSPDWYSSYTSEAYDAVAITPTPSVFPIPPRRSPALWKPNRNFAGRAVDHVQIRMSGTFTPTFGNGRHKPKSPAAESIASPANAYSMLSEEDEMRMWQAIRGDTPTWPVQGRGWKFARGTKSP